MNPAVQATTQDPVIEIDLYGPIPDQPGYSRLAGRKTIGVVFDEVRAIIGECPPGCTEGLGISPLFGLSRGRGTATPLPDPNDIRNTPWPEGRTVVFAVTGANEGHYLYVDVRNAESVNHAADAISTTVLSGKTFDGFDAAWDFAKRLAAILAV